jgi:hypothetical protein
MEALHWVRMHGARRATYEEWCMEWTLLCTLMWMEEAYWSAHLGIQELWVVGCEHTMLKLGDIARWIRSLYASCFV